MGLPGAFAPQRLFVTTLGHVSAVSRLAVIYNCPSYQLRW